MKYSDVDIFDYDRERIPRFVSAIYPIFLLKGWTYFFTHPNVPTEAELTTVVWQCIYAAIAHMNEHRMESAVSGTGRIYARVSASRDGKLSLTLTLDVV